ncbi:DUF383-domain-containing protein [Wallemia mellicola]|uniref:Protein HGH1 homolog n=1 Tax=Wallemia mellicola TaxID=1708541 RepID=A0AB74KDH1_9BASI|nr:DUF383-domain-containing protein [Wallemia mellicola]
MSEFKELVTFLRNENPTIRQIAIQNLAGFSTTQKQLFDNQSIQEVKLSCRDKPAIAHDAFSILVNISDSVLTSNAIVTNDFMVFLTSYIANPTALLADLACMLLSNLSKLPNVIHTICSQQIPVSLNNEEPSFIASKSESSTVQIEGQQTSFRAVPCLVEAFVQGANKPETAVESAEAQAKRKSNCHFLGSVFANITTTQPGREYFTSPSPSFEALANQTSDKEYPLAKLTAFTEHPNNIRRHGVASTIKNSTFVKDAHRALLAEDKEIIGGCSGVNMLPYVLLPLCGPEEFDIDEQEALPEVCQLLPETKKREIDPSVRKTHIETLLLLCTTLHGREYLRSRNTYVVIKAAHAEEKDQQVIDEMIKLVNLIMRQEGEETKIQELSAKESEMVDEDMMIEEV